MEIETTDVRQGNHPTHRRRFDSSSVTRTFFCKYDKFEDFCIWALGAAVMYNDVGYGFDRISRLLPQTWPSRPYLAATAIESATGFGQVSGEDDDGVPIYPKMRVVVEYQHMPFGLVSDASIGLEEWERYTQTLPSQNDVSYLNLPGGIMKYLRPEGAGGGDPHGTPVPYSIGMPQPTSIIRRKWCRIPWDAWGPGTTLFTRIYGDRAAGQTPFVGTLNNATLFDGYAPGSLLFLGVEEEPRLDPTAQTGDVGLSWDLTYSWMFKPVANHNMLYYFTPDGVAFPGLNGWYSVANTLTYQTISATTDNTSLFNVRDHELLFRVG